MKAVKYNSLIAPLIESTKDLYGMCKQTDAKVESIERKMASVQASDATQSKDISKLKSENKKLADENAALKARLDLIEKKLGIK